MTGVKQVKTTIGKPDPEPVPTPAFDLVERVRARHDLIGAKTSCPSIHADNSLG